MQGILKQAEEKFDKVLEVVNDDLATVKTGRAKPDLVGGIKVKVESYNEVLTLKELASISAPDAQQLLVDPWDKNIIESIVKAIANSDLNLSPVVTGEQIRISVPVLTEEGRQDRAKLVSKKMEFGKMMLREERKKLRKELEAMKGEAGITEDEVYRGLEELDKKTTKYTEMINQLGEEKKTELMQMGG